MDWNPFWLHLQILRNTSKTTQSVIFRGALERVLFFNLKDVAYLLPNKKLIFCALLKSGQNWTQTSQEWPKFAQPRKSKFSQESNFILCERCISLEKFGKSICFVRKFLPQEARGIVRVSLGTLHTAWENRILNFRYLLFQKKIGANKKKDIASRIFLIVEFWKKRICKRL